MDERARRIGLNEALFREVNERIAEVRESAHVQHMDIVCECGDLACEERFSIEPGDYERLRSEPTLFAVVPGHEIPDVESVVEEHPEYLTVRKRRAEAVELAEATDPRSE